MSKKNSIVGDLINFRGLVYAPLNENGVIFLFGRVAEDLHMYIEEIKPGFPDCVARRYTGKGWERVRIEFEFISSNFKQHGHNSDECDIVVCWEHDWKECPIEVIELKSEILGMPNRPVQKPTTSTDQKLKDEEAITKLFVTHHVSQKVQEYFHQIERALRDWNEEIWFNIGNRFIGVYSPEKSFASLKLQSSSLQIECFSRGEPLAGAKVASVKFSPRWAKLTIRNDDQIEKAIDLLKESHARLKAAMKAGEHTYYFGGGQISGGKDSNIDDNNDDDES